jgi:electron transfer flavoprotein beta subunit
LKICLCIKQVPGTTQVEVDPVTGVLKRDAVAGKLNPYDLYAIETAMRLKEEKDAYVCAITMGPGQAKDVLMEAMYMGADDAVLISDRKFAGADVLATSYTLSKGIYAASEGIHASGQDINVLSEGIHASGQDINVLSEGICASCGFDLILCGKQTTDGDTAQVGAEIAEFLGIPHANNVLSIEEAAEDYVIVRINLESHIATQKMPLPCLLCMDSEVNSPRLPSYLRKKELSGRQVRTLTLADLDDKEEKHYGLAGSPTQVERIFPPDKNTSRETLEGDEAILAGQLTDILRERKFI